MTLLAVIDRGADDHASRRSEAVWPYRGAVAAVIPISGLARLTGVTPRALRYYEDKGLIRPIRGRRGERHYPPREVEAARTVVLLRSLGIAIPQVARLIEPGRSSADVRRDLRQVLSGRAGELKASYDRVQAVLADLALDSEIRQL